MVRSPGMVRYCRYLVWGGGGGIATTYKATSMVADPHHFNADSYPAFHFNTVADSDPAPHPCLMRLIKRNLNL
jgi:hypothetical protein